jgi:hypothetical protein
METIVDETRLKNLLKEAIVEVFDERRDLLRDLLEEALEDAALAHAIAEGETTEIVGREKIFRIFEGRV